MGRRLASLRNARYTPGWHVPLVISVDHSGDNTCTEVARAFDWHHSPKTVIVHPRYLGLRASILAYGDLSQKNGAVAVREDDVVVSPFFHHFAIQALDFYKHTDSVGGIALYHRTLFAQPDERPGRSAL